MYWATKSKQFRWKFRTEGDCKFLDFKSHENAEFTSDGTMAGNTGISRKTGANILGRRIRIAPGQSQKEVPAAEMPEIKSSILQNPFFISRIRLKNLLKSRIS